MTGRGRAWRGSAGLVAVLSVILTACTTSPPSDATSPVAPPPAATDTPESPADPLLPPPVVDDPATVSGVAPSPSDDVPAVVVIEPAAGYAYPISTDRPMMDQVATRFTPAALVVRTGMPVDFRNDDDKLHNVRVRERGRPADQLEFNVALSQGVTFDHTFEKDGVWDVRCDMHQSMYGLVVSTQSPYAAVAAPDRTFTIGGLPPGDYTAVAYTSRDRYEKPLRLRPGEQATLAFP